MAQLLLVLIPWSSALGTLVLAKFSREYIVVAADSREYADGISSHDKACKIIQLDSHTFFFVTNIARIADYKKMMCSTLFPLLVMHLEPIAMKADSLALLTRGVTWWPKHTKCFWGLLHIEWVKMG